MNLALFGGSGLLFDNRSYEAMGIAKDSAITGWIGELGGYNGSAGGAGVDIFDQAKKGFRPQEWSVAVQD